MCLAEQKQREDGRLVAASFILPSADPSAMFTASTTNGPAVAFNIVTQESNYIGRNPYYPISI